MKDYRILNASETGKGILVEMDAGWISPSDPKNVDILREQKELLDYSSGGTRCPHGKSHSQAIY